MASTHIRLASPLDVDNLAVLDVQAGQILHSVGMPEVAEAAPDREALCLSQGPECLTTARAVANRVGRRSQPRCSHHQERTGQRSSRPARSAAARREPRPCGLRSRLGDAGCRGSHPAAVASAPARRGGERSLPRGRRRPRTAAARSDDTAFSLAGQRLLAVRQLRSGPGPSVATGPGHHRCNQGRRSSRRAKSWSETAAWPWLPPPATRTPAGHGSAGPG